jgi:hypothetical protein
VRKKRMKKKSAKNAKARRIKSTKRKSVERERKSANLNFFLPPTLEAQVFFSQHNSYSVSNTLKG